MPFGVELPEDLGAEKSSGATAPDTSPAPSSETKEPESTPIELDSLKSFRYKGQEYTQKDVERLLRGSEDESRYSGESQSSLGREDFEANYAADFAAVQNDPARLGEFAAIYPREFVVKAVAELNRHRQESQGSQPNVNRPPQGEQDSRFEKYDRMYASWEQAAQESRVAAITTQIDSWHGKLASKYPDADPKVVDGLALALNEKGIKIDEKVFEKLYKADHTEREAYYAKKYRTKAEAQLKANSRARDIAPGGEPLGSGKTQPKTLKEATQLALQTLNGRAN